MPDPVVDAAGIREVLQGLPDAAESDLGVYAERAALRLRRCISSAHYSALENDNSGSVLEGYQFDAGLLAGKHFGAAAYYATGMPPMGQRHVVMTTQVGDSTWTAATGEEVARNAARHGNLAIQILRDAGLYVRPSTSLLTRTDVDEDDD